MYRNINYYVNHQTSFYGKYEGVEMLCSNVCVGTAEIGPLAATSSAQIIGHIVEGWKLCKPRRKNQRKAQRDILRLFSRTISEGSEPNVR